MSDRFFASMTIGGKLKKDNIEEFLETLQNQGAYNKDESENTFRIKNIDDLEKFTNADGQIQIHDPEAAGGELFEVQSICIKLGLSYDHHNDAYYDCDATNEFVRNGKELGYVASNGIGSNLIADWQLQKAFGEKLESIDTMTPEEIKSILMDMSRLSIPSLPKFEIVD
jgi:hypothetical protein